MLTDRFQIRMPANGLWDILDGDRPSEPSQSAWLRARMGFEEAKQVVQLMNELDRNLRAKKRMR